MTDGRRIARSQDHWPDGRRIARAYDHRIAGRRVARSRDPRVTGPTVTRSEDHKIAGLMASWSQAHKITEPNAASSQETCQLNRSPRMSMSYHKCPCRTMQQTILVEWETSSVGPSARVQCICRIINAQVDPRSKLSWSTGREVVLAQALASSGSANDGPSYCLQ